jgi:glucose 1-dehydrogenase
MCRNGRYIEHGIKELDGFARERYRISPQFAVRVDPSLEGVGVLLEPASVLAKAWEHTEAIGGRARWEPRTVLVTGAGPIGLLAALMGAQRGFEVHVLNRSDEPLKRRLVEDLGGTFHTGRLQDTGVSADVVIECTGVPQVVFDAIDNTAAGGVVCLTGVSPAGRSITIDAGALNTEIVLENDAIFGSVNANRRHYEQGAEAMGRADPGWLERLITRRVPLDRWDEALRRERGDVKVVLEFAG